MAVTTGVKPQTTISVPLPSSRTYDILKHAATLVVPSILTLYFALAQIWDFPAQGQTEATISAANVALGGIVTFFRWMYNKSDAAYDGVINVTETNDKKTYQLELNGDEESLDGKDQLVFKVNQPSP